MIRNPKAIMILQNAYALYQRYRATIRECSQQGILDDYIINSNIKMALEILDNHKTEAEQKAEKRTPIPEGERRL